VLEFYACAAVYLAVALAVAWRSPGRARHPGLRGQLKVARAVLGAGLLWPERWAARVGPFGF
jgi:hypothetical protein